MPKFVGPKTRTALACLRAASGLRQHQLARRFDVSTSTLARYEQGLAKIPSALAERMAAYFQVTPTAFSAPKRGEVAAAMTRLFKVSGEGRW